jgi:hypothetical protein
METPSMRLLKWQPDYVIVTTKDYTMMDCPEKPALKHTAGNTRLIFVRNLSRRILQKYCTAEGQSES